MQALVVRFNFCLRLSLMIGILLHPLPGSLSVWVSVPPPPSELLPSSSRSLSRSRWIQPSGWRSCPPGSVRSTHPRGRWSRVAVCLATRGVIRKLPLGWLGALRRRGRFRLLGGFGKGLGRVAGGDDGQENSRDRLVFPHSRVFPPALLARPSSAFEASIPQVGS